MIFRSDEERAVSTDSDRVHAERDQVPRGAPRLAAELTACVPIYASLSQASRVKPCEVSESFLCQRAVWEGSDVPNEPTEDIALICESEAVQIMHRDGDDTVAVKRGAADPQGGENAIRPGAPHPDVALHRDSAAPLEVCRNATHLLTDELGDKCRKG